MTRASLVAPKAIGDPGALIDRLRQSFKSQVVSRLAQALLTTPTVFGNVERLSIDPTAQPNNAMFNTRSGTIRVDRMAFFGFNVHVLAGTHDCDEFGVSRQKAVPSTEHDIWIQTGAWVATGATIIGPCVVGEHAVVAAGSVVISDVPPYTVVAGVPAHPVRFFRPADIAMEA